MARAVFDELLADAGVPVYFGLRLASVSKTGNRITEVVGDNGQAFRGAMFIDATYEGDLMDRAGVAWTLDARATPPTARPSTASRSEVDISSTSRSPVCRRRKSFNRAAARHLAAPPAPAGSGDGLIQAYNYRMCLTQAASRIPFPKPAGYDAARYELLLRYVQAGWTGPFFTTHGVGNGKTDSNNNGAFSTDFIGANYAYPTRVVRRPRAHRRRPPHAISRA